MKNEIINLYKQGLSNVEIARRLGCCANTVWRHLKSVNILRLNPPPKNINWCEIQKIYDSGVSEKEMRRQGLVTRTQLNKAKEEGLFVARSPSENAKITAKNHPYSVSESARNKNSIAMKRRHELGLAYTLGHNERNKERSYPEKWFESVINNRLHNKNYESQYRFGRYCLDFAWPTLKKCIEVDGETHYRFDTEIQKDIRRDKWITEQGWEIIRFRWKHVINDKEKTIQIMKQFIDNIE